MYQYTGIHGNNSADMDNSRHLRSTSDSAPQITSIDFYHGHAQSTSYGPRTGQQNSYEEGGSRLNTAYASRRVDIEKQPPVRREAPRRRTGFDPFGAIWILLKGPCRVSLFANLLLPAIPAGIVLHFMMPKWHALIFIVNYIAMIPGASMLSFSSKELAKKVYRPVGILMDALFASSVEVILCLLLLFQHQYAVIQAALVGSILANLLLVTGICFIVGGFRYKHQTFDEIVTETGGGLILISVAGMILPTVFDSSIRRMDLEDIDVRTLKMSRRIAILLAMAYIAFLVFQLFTHHSIFDDMLKESEDRHHNSPDYVPHAKLKTSECIIFVAVLLACVTMSAVFMVQQIHNVVVEHDISDAFVGLILVPLVEKFSEHIVTVDEAWNDSMSFALGSILMGPVQTALFVTPVVVIVGWCAKLPMSLSFEVFLSLVMVMAVLVVGNFIKDNKSNYLEGILMVVFYVMITVGTWYYPNPPGMADH